MAHPTRTDRCGACGGVADDPLEVGGHTYLRCTDCGTGALSPMPTHDPATYYDAGYFTANRVGGYADYDADREEHLRNATARLDLVARHIDQQPQPATPHLVDVGCASGYVLDEARRRGWTAVGVDVSPWGQEQSRAKGHRVHGLLDDAVAERRPDAITFFQSLEHMVDPYDQLDIAADALVSGGVVVIETWNAASRVARLMGRRWQQLSPPSVTHLFTTEGLRRHLGRAGLEVVAAGPTSKRVSGRLVAGVIAQHLPRHRERIARMGSSPLARIAVPYRLGDLVTVVARRI